MENKKTKRKSSSYNQPIRDGIGGTSKRAMEIEREREREREKLKRQQQHQQSRGVL
jgi:hypothetical protein